MAPLWRLFVTFFLEYLLCMIHPRLSISSRKGIQSIALFLVFAGAIASSHAQLTINGAGATFPSPIYSKWFDVYRKVDPSVAFNYQSIGSGGGQRQISDGIVDFGASDSPMSDESLAKLPSKLLHIPTVAGAVVVTYNVPGLSGLKMSGQLLGEIFLGKIKKWNDPAIAKLNPGARLPKLDIVVVHRSDGSGTSFIWTDYLCTANAEWAAKVKKGTSVAWPTGIGAKGNEGVAGQVKGLPGTIGYVELIFALQNKMPMAEVQNKAGEFVKPTLEAVTAALNTVQIPDDFRFSMVNPDGAGVYPIAGATWLLVYQQQKDPVKGKKLVEFLKWMLKDGEKLATDLQYASLPEAVQARVLTAVESIKY